MLPVIDGKSGNSQYDIQRKNGNDIEYPGRHIKLLWDGTAMKTAN